VLWESPRLHGEGGESLKKVSVVCCGSAPKTNIHELHERRKDVGEGEAKGQARKVLVTNKMESKIDSPVDKSSHDRVAADLKRKNKPKEGGGRSA